MKKLLITSVLATGMMAGAANAWNGPVNVTVQSTGSSATLSCTSDMLYLDWQGMPRNCSTLGTASDAVYVWNTFSDTDVELAGATSTSSASPITTPQVAGEGRSNSNSVNYGRLEVRAGDSLQYRRLTVRCTRENGNAVYTGGVQGGVTPPSVTVNNEYCARQNNISLAVTDWNNNKAESDYGIQAPSLVYWEITNISKPDAANRPNFYRYKITRNYGNDHSVSTSAYFEDDMTNRTRVQWANSLQNHVRYSGLAGHYRLNLNMHIGQNINGLNDQGFAYGTFHGETVSTTEDRWEEGSTVRESTTDITGDSDTLDDYRIDTEYTYTITNGNAVKGAATGETRTVIIRDINHINKTVFATDDPHDNVYLRHTDNNMIDGNRIGSGVRLARTSDGGLMVNNTAYSIEDAPAAAADWYIQNRLISGNVTYTYGDGDTEAHANNHGIGYQLTNRNVTSRQALVDAIEGLLVAHADANRDYLSDWSQWTEVANTRVGGVDTTVEGQIQYENADVTSQQRQAYRIDTIHTGATTATFERTRTVVIVGPEDNPRPEGDLRETESRIVIEGSTREVRVDLGLVPNPGYEAPTEQRVEIGTTDAQAAVSYSDWSEWKLVDPSSKAKMVKEYRTRTKTTAAVTVTDIYAMVDANGDEVPGTRREESRTVSAEVVETEREERTVLNAAWQAANRALEAELEDAFDHGTKLTGTFNQGKASEFDLELNLDNGGITASKDFTILGGKKDSINIKPRAGVFGVGQGDYIGYHGGLALEYQNREIKDLEIRVGHDTGTHFHYQGSRNGFKGLRGSGQTEDSSYLEIHQGAKDEVKVFGRVDDAGKGEVGIHKNGARISVDNEGQVKAGWTFRF